ncbi:MAG: hypothetical protein K0R84_775 [Clostridia bacterium]|jgi:hypothetical protein|nr:hypothetical protein [Clostridia bacterium]
MLGNRGVGVGFHADPYVKILCNTLGKILRSFLPQDDNGDTNDFHNNDGLLVAHT